MGANVQGDVQCVGVSLDVVVGAGTGHAQQGVDVVEHTIQKRRSQSSVYITTQLRFMFSRWSLCAV
eukprot:246008-Amphidinium_carterae.1